MFNDIIEFVKQKNPILGAFLRLGACDGYKKGQVTFRFKKDSFEYDRMIEKGNREQLESIMSDFLNEHVEVSIAYLEHDKKEDDLNWREFYPINIKDKSVLLCPICGFDYNHISDVEKSSEGEDPNLKINFRCESNHKWSLILKFRKGNYFILCHSKFIDYKEYLASEEWKVNARNAKERFGYRCQICNKKGTDSTLHAHHRTYERIGKELPEDITVLCASCHELYEKNKRLNNGESSYGNGA